MSTRRPAIVLATLALAAAGAPAGALAQSPGDTQYQDPLASDTGPSRDGLSGQETVQAPRNTPELSSAPPRGGSPSSGATRRAAPPGPQLAATGAEPGLLALLGIGLVLAGTGLRLREPVA